jgi:acylphosphatase
MLSASVCLTVAACRDRAQHTRADDSAPLGELAVSPSPAPARPVDPNAIVVDKDTRSVSIPARVAQQGTQSALKGMIEYLLVARGGKVYETVFVTYRRPDEIRDALAEIGLHAGQPGGAETVPRGSPVSILAEYESGGKKIRRPADEFLTVAAGGKAVKPHPWVYTGSVNTTDPSSGKPILQASLTGSVVGLHTADGSSLLQNARPESRKDNFYKANVKALPPAGTPVRLVFQRTALPVPKGLRRAYAVVRGRVQGVGYRVFVQRQALVRGLKGFVRPLADGRVEVIVEGPAAKAAEFLDKLKQGPHAARVDSVNVTEERPEGNFKGFEIWL